VEEDPAVKEERAEEDHGPDSVGMEEERGIDVVEEVRGARVMEERGTGVVEEERVPAGVGK
jgi:hypothetical protein